MWLNLEQWPGGGSVRGFSVVKILPSNYCHICIYNLSMQLNKRVDLALDLALVGRRVVSPTGECRHRKVCTRFRLEY